MQIINYIYLLVRTNIFSSLSQLLQWHQTPKLKKNIILHSWFVENIYCKNVRHLCGTIFYNMFCLLLQNITLKMVNVEANWQCTMNKLLRSVQSIFPLSIFSLVKEQIIKRSILISQVLKKMKSANFPLNNVKGQIYH